MLPRNSRRRNETDLLWRSRGCASIGCRQRGRNFDRGIESSLAAITGFAVSRSPNRASRNRFGENSGLFSQSVGAIRYRDRGGRWWLACADHRGSLCQRFRETARAAGGDRREQPARLFESCLAHARKCAAARTCLRGCDFESSEWTNGFGAKHERNGTPAHINGHKSDRNWWKSGAELGGNLSATE